MLWLRADPEALRELRLKRDLLRSQGYYFIEDPGGRWDVVVAPLPGSPEMKYYEGFLKGVEDRRIVSERDPLAAISRAVAYPRQMFSRMILAVDSGTSLCGLAALADGTVLEASSAPCDEVARRAQELNIRVPHRRLWVVVGDGSGFEEVARQLLELGLPMSFIDESGTTALRIPLPLRLRDANARAAVALALRASVNH